MLDLRQNELRAWMIRNFGEHSDDLLKCTIGIGEEVGEIAEAILVGTKHDIIDGIGDTLIYSLQVLGILGINAQVALKPCFPEKYDAKDVFCGTGNHIIHSLYMRMAMYSGRVSHHILKGVQCIREGQDGLDSKLLIKDMCGMLNTGIEIMLCLHASPDDELSAIIAKVMARDWRQNPDGNHQNG